MGFEPMTILLQHQCTTEACRKAKYSSLDIKELLEIHSECSRYMIYTPNNVYWYACDNFGFGLRVETQKYYT